MHAGDPGKVNLFCMVQTVPIFVPTPRIEALPGIASPSAQKARKALKTRDISQRLPNHCAAAKSLIVRGLMVRDQEVGGSNPLAPTKFLKSFQRSKPRGWPAMG